MEYTQLAKEFYKNKENYEKLYRDRYYSEFTLHIPISINGNEAFLTYPAEIMNLISKIYKSDKILSEKIRELPSIALEQFTKKCLIDEIKLSNDIEGVYSTRKEINELLKPEAKSRYKKRLYGLVQKYKMLSNNEDICVASCEDIRNLYNDLVLREVMEEDKRNEPDGLFFRKEGVSVQGSDLKVVHNGVNPEEKIICYMDECLKLINDNSINKLVAIGVLHYLIGYIHPFYDGNGRLDRFISSHLLSKELHPLVGYSLSYTIKKQINLYYKAFKIVNDIKNKGDITPFVIIFLNFVVQAIDNLNDTLTNKIEQMNYYRQIIGEYSNDGRVRDILFILVQNTLFGEEGLAIENIANILQVSIPTIRNYFGKLDNELLIVSKMGHKNVYDINLEYFNVSQ